MNVIHISCSLIPPLSLRLAFFFFSFFISFFLVLIDLLHFLIIPYCIFISFRMVLYRWNHFGVNELGRLLKE